MHHKSINDRAIDYAPSHEHFQECYKDACYEQKSIDNDNALKAFCNVCEQRCLVCNHHKCVCYQNFKKQIEQ